MLPALFLAVTLSQVQGANTNRYGQVPLFFEPNQGQSQSDSKFLVRRGNYTMFFRQDEAILAVAPPQSGQGGAGTETIRFRWLNSRATRIAGDSRGAGRSHYLLGRDRSKWTTNVPQFGRVRYHNLYPGIDLVYYGNDGLLEYDLIVAPGTDTSAIRLQVTGGTGMEVRDGDLMVQTNHGTLVHKAPVAYQEVAGGRRTVESKYRLGDDGELTFELGEYDRSRELVIDPTISYGRLFGGTGADGAEAIAVDSTGAAYIAGSTLSSDLPTTGGPTTPGFAAYGGSSTYDAFVLKLNPAGSVVYATYIGGGGNDQGHAVAVDGNGNVLVAGQTASADFPTANTTRSSLNGITDAFLTRLTASGSSASYSSYIGGSGSDIAWGVAVDSSRNAYVVGQTTSSILHDNPVSGQSRSGSSDAFIARVTAANAFSYVRFIGGTGTETAYGVAASGNYVYVTGTTTSTNLTGTGMQASNGGGNDAFLQKANAADGSQVFWAYHGGAANEFGRGVALDSTGTIYIAGYVNGGGMPTVNPLQANFSGTAGSTYDGFVVATDNNGSARLAATYLGGTGDDQILGIAVNPNDSVFVTGYTGSADFPTTNNIRTGTLGLSTDAFLTKYAYRLNSYLFSTYLGGSGTDKAYGVAADSTGAYITGSTLSGDFQSVTGTLQNQDAFVMKLSSTCSYSFNPNPLNLAAAGGQTTVTVTVGSECGWGATTSDSFLTIGSPAYGAGNGSFTVTATANNTPSARSGSIKIAGVTIPVTQASSCTYGLSSAGTSVTGAAVSTGSVTLTASSGACNWSAVSSAAWLTVTSAASGNGTGSVGYRVAINPLPTQRTATLAIGGQTFTVTQAGRSLNSQSIATFNNGAWRVDATRAFAQSAANLIFAWGTSGWTAVAGDWNGDGITKVGVFKDGVWILDMNNSRTWDNGDRMFQWGNPGMTPVVGDWNGDGKTEVGVFSNGNWYIDVNGNFQLDNAEAFAWGPSNGVPKVGDWNGDGKTKVGSYNPATGAWILDTNGDTVYQPLSDFYFQWGAPGFTPLVGDFFGLGRDTVGAYLSGRFWLENGDGFSNAGDVNFTFISNSTGTPIIGDWNGDGKAKVGIQTGNIMTIDYDGNGAFNVGSDKQFTFGNTGDAIVTGRWQ